MKNDNLPNCLFLGALPIKDRIHSVLKNSTKMYFLDLKKDSIGVIQSEKIDCVILFIQIKIKSILKQIDLIKSNYSDLPIIGIIESEVKIEVVRKCGEIGVNAVLDCRQLMKLRDLVPVLVNRNTAKVTLKDFNINEENGSKLLQRALKIIETNYLDLMSTNEIALQLNIHESTLSREFKKNNLANPKRLLLYFKVGHASKLMKKENLNLKSIAFQSGFSNEQRFNDCFKRLFNKTPNEYRQEFN